MNLRRLKQVHLNFSGKKTKDKINGRNCIICPLHYFNGLRIPRSFPGGEKFSKDH